MLFIPVFLVLILILYPTFPPFFGSFLSLSNFWINSLLILLQFELTSQIIIPGAFAAGSLFATSLFEINGCIFSLKIKRDTNLEQLLKEYNSIKIISSQFNVCYRELTLPLALFLLACAIIFGPFALLAKNLNLPTVHGIIILMCVVNALIASFALITLSGIAI